MNGATKNPESTRIMPAQRLGNDLHPHSRTLAEANCTSYESHDPARHSAGIRGQDEADAVLNLLHQGVVVTDPAGVVTYMNRRAEKITGHDLALARGRSIADILLCCGEERLCPRTLDGSELGCLRIIELATDTGDHCTLEIRVVPLPRRASDRAGYLYELRDVSESVRRTQQLMHDATHDPLTGLANRRALIERLDQVLEWVPDQNEPESILAVLDLDGFKGVNDSCGHLSGDEMLHDIAQLLQVKTRKADTAARLGGDEFVVLLPGCGMNAARALLENIRSAIAVYCYRADGVEYRVTASIGIAGIDAETRDAQTILRRADEACYRAKHAGGDRIVVHGQYESAESVTTLQRGCRSQYRAEVGGAVQLRALQPARS